MGFALMAELAMKLMDNSPDLGIHLVIEASESELDKICFVQSGNRNQIGLNAFLLQKSAPHDGPHHKPNQINSGFEIGAAADIIHPPGFDYAMSKLANYIINSIKGSLVMRTQRNIWRNLRMLTADFYKDPEEFFITVKKGDVDQVENFIKKNPGILKNSDSFQHNALHLSAIYGTLEVTKLLVEKYSQCGKTSKNGFFSMQFFNTSEILVLKLF